MPPVGFEPTISAGEQPKTYALDHTATGTGMSDTIGLINVVCQNFKLQLTRTVIFFAVNIVTLR